MGPPLSARRTVRLGQLPSPVPGEGGLLVRPFAGSPLCKNSLSASARQLCCRESRHCTAIPRAEHHTHQVDPHKTAFTCSPSSPTALCVHSRSASLSPSWAGAASLEPASANPCADPPAIARPSADSRAPAAVTRHQATRPRGSVTHQAKRTVGDRGRSPTSRRNTAACSLGLSS